MFKRNEISFIVNTHNRTLASLIYDTIPHSHKDPHHINPDTKLVIFYCNNSTRIKVFNQAKRLGIYNKIIYVQPWAHENKMIQHTLLDGKLDQPETKIFLEPDDSLKEYIVKPYQGFYGKGIEHAASRYVYNKFFQKRIQKVREFRIIYGSWFENDEQSIVFEKVIKNKSELTWNFSNGSEFRSVSYETDKSIIDRLRSYGKLLCKELHLDYIAADFVLDENDKLYFLECNWMTNHDHPYVKITDDYHLDLFRKLISMEEEILYKKFYKNFT